jgi:hypothetical protein
MEVPIKVTISQTTTSTMWLMIQLTIRMRIIASAQNDIRLSRIALDTENRAARVPCEGKALPMSYYQNTITDPVPTADKTAVQSTPPLCWICKTDVADSGEHKTKRSDLLAVLGKPTQAQPFYYHDLHKRNRPVGSLDARILKSPVRICSSCNSARTQPHDQAWERMSDWLRERRPPLAVGDLVRGDRIFPQNARREMEKVHLYFLKLFGCMICEAVANGHQLPIDIEPFSKAIMSNRPHPEVYLQFGRCDGTIGRSNLHCFTTEQGSVLAGWLYELDTIAVSVLFAQAGRWNPAPGLWQPRKGSNRVQIGDFRYDNRKGTTGGS